MRHWLISRASRHLIIECLDCGLWQRIAYRRQARRWVLKHVEECRIKIDLSVCPACGVEVKVGRGGVYCPIDDSHLRIVFDVVWEYAAHKEKA